MIVSVIVPLRNEGDFVGRCLQSILAEIGERQDAEILCVDGLSTDRTRQIIGQYAARDPRIRLVDNPGRTPPCALNLGIRHARGRIILRMDAHSECSPGYVWKNVEVLQRTGAECVGGYLLTRPGRDTPVGRAIAAALSSPFGVGGCRSRTTGGKEEESDEATFGCFPRELFERIGMFDERLTRNQDMEFFCRIRKRGGRIIISPEIQATYFSRPTYGGMRGQAFGNGLWGGRTLWLIGGGLRPRHLVPLLFVLSIVGLGVLGLFWWPFRMLLALEMLVYVAAGSAMALKAARSWGASAFLVFLAFFQLHVSYGLGTLWGFVTAPLKYGLPRRSEVSAPDTCEKRPAEGQRPLVSVVAPMRNEEVFIRQFIESMLAQTYPADRLEILLVDGGSTDRTLQIAREMAARHPRLRILHNPDRFLPQGENVGVRNARGEIVARADIHVGYPPDYIASCVETLLTHDAWVVGGILRTEPGGAGRVAAGIAVVQSHLFGVGNSSDRISDKQSWNTDVAFPCMWRWVFGKIGLYHELLPRHEDLLLYSRVRRLGGHLLVDPAIRSIYYAPPTAGALVKQAWNNGYETVLAWVADRGCVSLRHWVPGAFVALLMILALGAIFWWPAGVALMIVGGLYGLAWFVACLDVGFRRGWRHVPVVAVVFVLHHITYGLGTLAGIGAAIRDWRKIKDYHVPTLDK